MTCSDLYLLLQSAGPCMHTAQGRGSAVSLGTAADAAVRGQQPLDRLVAHGKITPRGQAGGWWIRDEAGGAVLCCGVRDVGVGVAVHGQYLDCLVTHGAIESREQVDGHNSRRGQSLMRYRIRVIMEGCDSDIFACFLFLHWQPLCLPCCVENHLQPAFQWSSTHPVRFQPQSGL